MSEELDRRAFLGGAAAVGALAAAAITPLTARALTLAPGRELVRSSGEPVAAHGWRAAPGDADWHIDDMWGHTPRYAHPIPHAPMRTSPIAWEHVDPIDRFLVI
ncbi:MAG: twin-arginine translocation signal domain-containing protein [Steroidobacteraceae bacterium]